MNIPIDRMDNEHEKMIRIAVIDLLKFLDKEMQRSKVYTHVNMCINVLTGAIITLAHNFVAEEDEERFIKQMVLTLKANFDANRDDKRRP